MKLIKIILKVYMNILNAVIYLFAMIGALATIEYSSNSVIQFILVIQCLIFLIMYILYPFRKLKKEVVKNE